MNTPSHEDEIRSLLHHEVEGVHASADLDARVFRGARRVRRVKAGTIGAMALLAMGGLLLVALPKAQTSTEATVRAAPPHCPTSIPVGSVTPSHREGADRTLVPGTPTAAVACTYQVSTASDGTPQATLVTSKAPVQLTGATLNGVVAALNQPVHGYAFRCPSARSYRELMLRFDYGAGPQVTVVANLHCPGLSNGTLSGAFNPQGTLPPALTALITKN
ncbi:hypothetical protein [Actinacidiphila oryziradicis]|uniref:Uncharacterized protein n=1 Tax=Actinacidiphila oryziradicis TaxID=2571141 RepID=A0A4U0RZT6_9ACTN|nr:hypothetical protein [Actinacidiphila oryziradicis]TKA01980.1 hypothetical protein FCI23_39610 [Actinacidiphila oryziradicis]